MSEIRSPGQTPGAPTPAAVARQSQSRVPVEVTGAQALVLSLENVGAEVVFGIPGGAILPAYDPLMDSVTVRHVLCRHEQGAGHAAEGWAASTGKVGVCMATSGPGATNLVTGIANAMMDSVPIVCITGNVAQGLMGTDAFQEIDILGVTLPIVKHSILVRSAAEVPAAIEEAFHIAASGRPGPVLVDLPKDVQFEMTAADYGFSIPNETPRVDHDAIAAAEAAIRAAKKPLVYIGGGVKIGRATEALRALAETTAFPAQSRPAEETPAEPAEDEASADEAVADEGAQVDQAGAEDEPAAVDFLGVLRCAGRGTRAGVGEPVRRRGVARAGRGEGGRRRRRADRPRGGGGIRPHQPASADGRGGARRGLT